MGDIGHINGNTATYSTSPKIPFNSVYSETVKVDLIKWLRQNDECKLISKSTIIKHNETDENTKRVKTHLSCEIIPSRQVFEAEETVPLAGSTSAGVIVHNLARTDKMRSIIHLEKSVFVHC